MTDILLIVALVLLAAVLVLQFVLLKRRAFTSTDAMQLTIEAMRRSQEQALADVRQDVGRCSDAVDAAARRIQEHVSTSLAATRVTSGEAQSQQQQPPPQQTPVTVDIEPLRQAMDQSRTSLEQSMKRLQEELRGSLERAVAVAAEQASLSSTSPPQRFTPVRREVGSSPFRVDPPAS